LLCFQLRKLSQQEVVLGFKGRQREVGALYNCTSARARLRAKISAKESTMLLNQLLANCDNSTRGIRNQVLLRSGYETMRRQSELCAFKFENICQAPNGKPAVRLNFSKTDQFGTGKLLPISQDLFDLLEKWRSMISDEGYILRPINKYGHFGNNLHPASISTLFKALQKDLEWTPMNNHSAVIPLEWVQQ